MKTKQSIVTLVERGNMDDISLNSLDPCGQKKVWGGLKDTAFPAPMRQIPPLYRLESRLSARRCAKQGHRLKMLICITHCPLTEGIMTNKGRCLRGDYWDYCYFPLIHTARFICFFLKFLTIGGFCFAERFINWVFLASFALIPCIFLGTWQCEVILNEELKPMTRQTKIHASKPISVVPFVVVVFSWGCNSLRLSIAEVQLLCILLLNYTQEHSCWSKDVSILRYHCAI